MKRAKTISIVAACALLASLALLVTVHADRSARVLMADLNGFEEVPAVSSTGRGQLFVKIHQDESGFDYHLSYDGLEGTTTSAAHIHLGQRGVNGGVSVFLCGGGGKPPCPNPGGTVTGSATASDVIGPTGQGLAPGELSELLRAMREGATYANVHTNKHPGGEIRGQLK